MPLLRIDILRRALEPFLICSSMTDMLDMLDCFFGLGYRHVEHVNFMCFWHGMEKILRAHGTYVNGGLDIATEQHVASIQYFRDRAFAQSLVHDMYSAMDLRRLFEEVQCSQYASVPAVFHFWKDQIDRLSLDGTVTDDMVSRALLGWLLELLQDHLHSEATEPPSPASMHSASSSSSKWSARGLMARDRSVLEPQARNRIPSWLENPEVVVELPDVQRFQPPSPASMQSECLFAWDPSALEPQPHSRCIPLWLENPEAAEPPDVQRFRNQLKRRLMEHPDDENSDDSGLVLSHLFYTIRDTIATKPSNTTLRAGVSLLNGVVVRHIRPMFRKLDKWTMHGIGTAPSFDASPQYRNFDLVVEAICSQAKAMVVLERQKETVPWLYRLAWLLNRARSRRMRDVLNIWHHFGECTGGSVVCVDPGEH